MNKKLTALTVALLCANVAIADVPPPPPPKGKKYISVNSEVILGKDVTGYVFVTQVSTFPARGATHAKVEFPAGKAVAMPAGGRRTFVELIAVPQDAAKEFKTDAELFTALGTNKVKGTQRLGFGGTATVADTIKGASVKWTHTITAIDAKGIKAKVEGEGYEVPVPKKGKEPLALGGLWMAGGAAALAVMFGGLWVVGRKRRKV